LKKYKSPGSDEIPAELIQTRDEILLSAIDKFINSVWNKEKLPISGRTPLLYQFTKRVAKLTVTTSYKILWNILFSMSSRYIDKIIGDHHCGFLRNRSTTDQIICIRQILEKKNESTMRQYISYS
jgi:hypothetical protein